MKSGNTFAMVRSQYGQVCTPKYARLELAKPALCTGAAFSILPQHPFTIGHWCLLCQPLLLFGNEHTDRVVAEDVCTAVIPLC